MEKKSEPSDNKVNVWLRGLYMLLMMLVLHVFGTVLVVVAIIQFVIVLMNDSPNERLVTFGRNLGIYLRQIAHFLTFASEEVPFPFSEWPAGTS
jgi:hypothetical protein